MTEAKETSQEEGKAGPQQGVDLSLLWLWPVLLFHALLQAFATDAHKLKALRRKKQRYSNPQWRIHVENLRLTEWEVRAYISGHALRQLAGQPVDLSDGLVPPPPPDWTRPEPKSASELIRRFEAIARIYADPRRAIARYLRRRARRTASPSPTTTIPAMSPPMSGASTTILRSSSPDPRIRAPPVERISLALNPPYATPTPSPLASPSGES